MSELSEVLKKVQPPLCGWRATQDELTITMPKDTVLISGRRLVADLTDSEILLLVKSCSVAIINQSEAAAGAATLARHDSESTHSSDAPASD